MALGTAPARLVTLLQNEWQDVRAGRGDIPDVIRDSDGDPTSDPDESSDTGVLILQNREAANVRQQSHDVIHLYHPDGDAPTTTDNGYKEQRITETVQIDIDLTDRTVHDTDPSRRLSANDLMVGDRADLAATDEPPYSGISGEVRYILEKYRRGFAEWDRIESTPVGWTLKNSNATVRWHADCIQLATNTVR